MALVKVSGSDEAIYFDDMVLMYMKNYEGSLAALNILETMSSDEYSKVFPAPICHSVLTPAPILTPNPKSIVKRERSSCGGSNES